MPFLAFFAGPMGKIALYAMAAVAIIGVVWGVIHEHDGRIRAEDAAKVAAATATMQIAQAKAGAEAVQASAAEAIARAREVNTVKLEIAHAPVTQACAASPAINAALDGLRGGSGPGGSPPVNPAGAAGVRPAAGAARAP